MASQKGEVKVHSYKYKLQSFRWKWMPFFDYFLKTKDQRDSKLGEQHLYYSWRVLTLVMVVTYAELLQCELWAGTWYLVSRLFFNRRLKLADASGEAV
jgi:hypothetical protein